MELSIDELAWIVNQMRRTQGAKSEPAAYPDGSRPGLMRVTQATQDAGGWLMLGTDAEFIRYDPARYRLFVEALPAEGHELRKAR